MSKATHIRYKHLGSIAGRTPSPEAVPFDDHDDEGLVWKDWLRLEERLAADLYVSAGLREAAGLAHRYRGSIVDRGLAQCFGAPRGAYKHGGLGRTWQANQEKL